VSLSIGDARAAHQSATEKIRHEAAVAQARDEAQQMCAAVPARSAASLASWATDASRWRQWPL
jgi:hypothetical protein